MSLLRCYRRDGTPYPPGQKGVLEWARDCGDREGCIVKQDTLPSGHWVSTVWIGLAMGLSGIPGYGPPLIFETMVWDAQEEIVDQDRYATEEDAIVGHVQKVDELMAAYRAEKS